MAEGKEKQEGIISRNILKRNLSASTSNYVQCYRPQEWPIPIQRIFFFFFFFLRILLCHRVLLNILPPDRSRRLLTD